MKSAPPSIRIHDVRGQKVVLDSDLARIYGVTTAAFNQATTRNLKKFPPDFFFLLNPKEVALLISQNVISKAAQGGRTKPPRVFTEHGALMAATLLRSERAVAMSVYIIRTFVELREQLASNAAILKRLAEIDQTLMVHDKALREVIQKLRPLLEPPPDPPKPRIGFHPKP
jgi:hypothetical protein